MLAVGIEAYFVQKAGGDDRFEGRFDAFLNKQTGQYIFGYFSYDLKNEFEPFLTSGNTDYQQFLYTFFFVPKHVFIKDKNGSKYYGAEPKGLSDLLKIEEQQKNSAVQLNSTLSKEEYLEKVRAIQEELQQGNVYELNFCQNFIGKGQLTHSMDLYNRLVDKSEAPFSAYLNLQYQEVFCASPERFLKKSGNKLISQPIKGTSRRGVTQEEDRDLIEKLKSSEKELAENIMIVDLVRNDLSKVAAKNSVRVDALNEVQTFNTVHQLVSTVSCELRENVQTSEIIKALFPMGSMTGAPKISAMQLSEQYENFKRGLYSGAIGYFDPNGDFDFNVVIRSIIYHKKSKIFSAPVGGAITIQSDPEQEYEECLVKLKGLQEVLSS